MPGFGSPRRFFELKGGDTFVSSYYDGKLSRFMKLREAFEVGASREVKNAVCLETIGHHAGDLVFFADGIRVEP